MSSSISSSSSSSSSSSDVEESLAPSTWAIVLLTPPVPFPLINAWLFCWSCCGCCTVRPSDKNSGWTVCTAIYLVIKMYKVIKTIKKKKLIFKIILLETGWAARTLLTCCCKSDVARWVGNAILLVITGPESIVCSIFPKRN